MKRYKITAYLLLLMAALWVFPAPRALAADDEAAAEETTSAEGTGSLSAYLKAKAPQEEHVLTPEEKAQLKREEKARKAEEKREEKERKAQERREKKHKKRTNQKYQLVYEDDSYVYYLDMENLRWRDIPYTEEKMLDVWVRLIPVADSAAAEKLEDEGGFYMGHYYLEHYYMRKKTRQIQFLAELEVTGRPNNDVETGKYRSAAWEELVPGSIEDALYNRIMKRMSNPKEKATSTSLTSFLEDVFRISL